MILLILQFSFFLFSRFQVLFTPLLLLEHPQLCSSLKWNIFKRQKTREHRVNRKGGALIAENTKIKIKIRTR